jgi:hypothetical protein
MEKSANQFDFESSAVRIKTMAHAHIINAPKHIIIIKESGDTVATCNPCLQEKAAQATKQKKKRGTTLYVISL